MGAVAAGPGAAGTTDTERELLESVRANKAHDTRRLVFADYLDGSGAPEANRRATFIRIGCEPARLRPAVRAVLRPASGAGRHPDGLWPWLWEDEYPEVNRLAVPASYCEPDIRRWDADEDDPADARVAFRRGFVAALERVWLRAFLPHAERLVRDRPGLETVGLLAADTDLVTRTGEMGLSLWAAGSYREFAMAEAALVPLLDLPAQDELSADWSPAVSGCG